MTIVVFNVKDQYGASMPFTTFSIRASIPNTPYAPGVVVPAATTFTTDNLGAATVTLLATEAPYFVTRETSSTDEMIGYKLFVPESATPLAAELLYVDLGLQLKLHNDRSVYALIDAKVGVQRALENILLIQELWTARITSAEAASVATAARATTVEGQITTLTTLVNQFLAITPMELTSIPLLDNAAALLGVSGVGGAIVKYYRTRGYATSTDGGGGDWYWDAASTATHNGGTVVKPSSIGVGVSGRWLRLRTGQAANPIWFGAVGDGVADDTVPVNAALALAGRIAFTKKHVITGILVIQSNTTLEWVGEGEIICTGSAGLRSTGTAGSTYDIVSGASLGSSTLVLGSGYGAYFTIGDTVLVTSSDAALSVDTHLKGEIVIIQNIVNDNLILGGSLKDTYTTGAQVRKLDTTNNIHLVNPRMRNTLYAAGSNIASQASPQPTPTSILLNFTFARGLYIQGGTLKENNGGAIKLNNCIDVRISDLICKDLRYYSYTGSPALSIYGSGIDISGATSNVVINNTVFRRCMNGIVTGTSGQNTPPLYGVQRNINVTGCVASECTRASFYVSEDTDGMTFAGCTVTSGNITGFQVLGNNVSITGCNVTGILGNGIYMAGSAKYLSIVGGTVSKCQRTTSANTARIADRGNGLYLGGVGITVSGVTVTECANNGALFEGASGRDTTITGCSFTNNGDGSITGTSESITKTETYGVGETQISRVKTYVYPNKPAGIKFDAPINTVSITGCNISDNRPITGGGSIEKRQAYGIWFGEYAIAPPVIDIGGTAPDIALQSAKGYLVVSNNVLVGNLDFPIRTDKARGSRVMLVGEGNPKVPIYPDLDRVSNDGDLLLKKHMPMPNAVWQGNTPINTPGGVFFVNTAVASIALGATADITVTFPEDITAFVSPNNSGTDKAALISADLGWYAAHTVVLGDIAVVGVPLLTSTYCVVRVKNMHVSDAQIGVLMSRIDVRRAV